jgi:hypothetical protein
LITWHRPQPKLNGGVVLNTMYIVLMRQKLAIPMALAFALGAGANANVADSSARHYEEIPKRNIFGLKAPEPAQTPPQEPALSKLVLAGTCSVVDPPRALIDELPPPGAGPAAGKKRSLILAAGERDGNVEVLEINERAGSVTVRNSGTLMVLTFDKDGAKLPSTPTPTPAVAGIPTNTAAVLPPLGMSMPPTNPATPLPVPPKGNGLMRLRNLPTRHSAAVAPGGASVTPGALPAPEPLPAVGAGPAAGATGNAVQ